MPTLQVYLPEADYTRLVRIAERMPQADLSTLTSTGLASMVLQRIIEPTAGGRKLRSMLGLPVV